MGTRYDFLIVGAGFSGCVLAERLAAESARRVLLIDRRPHLGGNAYDGVDDKGILIHHYGPHLFHTNNRDVFEYLSRFTAWRRYEHRVLANVGGRLYPIPINRTTLQRKFSTACPTEADARELIERLREPLPSIRNSEEIILDRVGRELFEAFFRGYTRKQWQREPRDLSPGVCGRIPLRYDTDDRYFTDRYQYTPAAGYTEMFRRMAAHPLIECRLGVSYTDVASSETFDRLIYTGPIDEYFGYIFGRLPYRSIRFEHRTHDTPWLQPVAQINFCDAGVPYTRQCEWKHITGQDHPMTTITREYPQKDGDPFYPVPSDESHARYEQYHREQEKLRSVFFAGRLAEYRYYNMDQVVSRSLHLFRSIARGTG